MKKILVVLDGVGDLPCSELGGKTPLEAANTPNLDFFAARGKCGYMYPIKEGVAPESDAAIIAILGYDPYKYFTGRGPLEAYGAGINIKTGDLALRTNFATVQETEGKKEIIDRRAGRTLSNEEATVLAKAINKNVKLQFPFIFKATVEHRGVLVVRGGFSSNITNTDPAYIGGGIFGIAKPKKAKAKFKVQTSKPLDEDEVTAISANIVNSFVEQSYSILNKHPVNNYRIKKKLLPANIILTRDAGTELPDFPKKRGWGAIVALPLEKAIAKLCGMNVLKFRYPGVTGHAYNNIYNMLKREIEIAKKYLRKKFKRYDSFYVHLKETDVPGHDGLAGEKKKMIEVIDKEFFSFIRSLAEKGILLIVTADHSTPCSIRAHSADPVPLLVYGKGKDSVKRFNEKACKRGSLGKVYGKDLLKSL